MKAVDPTTLESQARHGSKLQYSAPRLVRYGEVAELTKGGVTGLAEGKNASLMRKIASDVRAKQNIRRVGTHSFGFGLYLFDYKPEFRDACGHGRQFGVMADEVETVMPAAVSIGANGYKQVDYAMLGIQPTAS